MYKDLDQQVINVIHNIAAEGDIPSWPKIADQIEILTALFPNLVAGFEGPVKRNGDLAVRKLTRYRLHSLKKQKRVKFYQGKGWVYCE